MALNEGAHNAEFILSEASGERSRGLVTIPAGQGKVAPGTLLTTAGVRAAADYSDAAIININWVDATTVAQKAAIFSRDGEVHGEFLAWPNAETDVHKVAAVAALAERGILVRWTVHPAGIAYNGGDAGIVIPDNT
jgi:hypothetical protein